MIPHAGGVSSAERPPNLSASDFTFRAIRESREVSHMTCGKLVPAIGLLIFICLAAIGGFLTEEFQIGVPSSRGDLIAFQPFSLEYTFPRAPFYRRRKPPGLQVIHVVILLF